MTAAAVAVLFTSPLAALGTAAAAVAVPVVIHLLNRRNYRVVDWAAMRFLQAAVKRTTRRMRLEQWLLLLVRCLVILLPLLAMAAITPWAERIWANLLPGTAETAALGRSHRVIVLDASLSMSRRRDDGTAFERARAKAVEFARNAPAGDGLSVVVLADPPRSVVPGPADDPRRVAREIELLQPTHGSAELGPTLAAVEELLRRRPGVYARREVVVFTDLQRATWAMPTSAGGPAEAWQRLQQLAQVIVADFGADAGDNLAVTDLTTADPLVTTGAATAVTATLHNFGNRDRDNVKVELWVGKTAASNRAAPGDGPFAARVERQEAVTLPAGTAVSVTFPLLFRTPGDYLVQVRVEPDALDADDVRSLPLTVRDALSVLVIDGEPSGDRLASPAGWLVAALDPFGDGKRRPGYPLRPDVVGPARFADPAFDISPYDCVIACDMPRPGEREAARFESVLKRGGGVVFALGPRADAEAYNRVLGRDGKGPLPVKLLGVREGQFHPSAETESFRRPPLAAFAGDDDRAALTSARIQKYWRVEPFDRAARRVLAVEPSPTPADPLLLEVSRFSGRVFVLATPPTAEWSSWPIAPSFPPFAQELVRAAVPPSARRALAVGEPIDEPLPPGLAVTAATVTTPAGATETVPLPPGEDGPRLRYAATDRAGLYRVKFGPADVDRVFAVNVEPSGESDPRRINPAELQGSVEPNEPQIVTDPAKASRKPGAAVTAGPGPVRGPVVARWALLIGSILLLVEMVFAWRIGSARSAKNPLDAPAPRPWRDRLTAVLATALLGPLVVAGLGLLVMAVVGDPARYLPNTVRNWVETSLGVPTAGPGEGTRWRVEGRPVFTADANADRWLVALAGAAAVVAAVAVYRRELPAERHTAVTAGPPAGLRLAVLLLALLVLLPQLQLVFEREGWPDVAVLIDDSQSMAGDDRYPVAAKLAGRWLDDLLAKRARVHVYRVSAAAVRVAEVGDVARASDARLSLAEAKPTGPASRLGDAVRGVLDEFRGGSLAAVILATDGVTTDGDDLPTAAKFAARAGVPLMTVGLGDDREPPDRMLTDPRIEDVAHVGDRLVFEARLVTRGDVPAGPVPVILSEKRGDQLSEIGRQDVTPEPDGGPAKVRVTHTPTEPGDRVYVLEVAAAPGETDAANNRLERTVTVLAARTARVLYVEGTARYEFRFLKSFLERESGTAAGGRAVDLKVLLLDADADYPRQDRVAVEAFPSTKEELFEQYDVVILGDADPRHPKLGERHLRWLADFVRDRGGGLLWIAGPRQPAAAWMATPLADVLPVEPARPEPPLPATGYRLTLSPVGQSHPVFRLAADEADNLAAWGKLMPMFGEVPDWRPRPAAEVLASRDGRPLAVQQFAGAGRAMAFGFDESWRWGHRNDRRTYNQFWIQTIRYLARTRPGRPELRLDRQTAYRRGEPIRLTVRFPEDRPPPETVRVSLERTAPDGEVEMRSLTPAKVDGSRATFEAVVAPTPDGRYRFTLTTPAEDAKASVECRVVPPPGELDRLRMNRADLERSAAVSRGRFYPAATAERVVAELPPLPRVALDQPRPPWPLWSGTGVYAVLVLMLTAEWVLRKRVQLV